MKGIPGHVRKHFRGCTIREGQCVVYTVSSERQSSKCIVIYKRMGAWFPKGEELYDGF
jgi:hypothetical protein